MFPERCDRGAISYLEGQRVPKNWGVVTERIRKVFAVKSGGMNQLENGRFTCLTYSYSKIATCPSSILYSVLKYIM